MVFEGGLTRLVFELPETRRYSWRRVYHRGLFNF